MLKKRKDKNRTIHQSLHIYSFILESAPIPSSIISTCWDKYTDYNYYYILCYGVYIDWTNSIDPVKFIQSNPKKWIRSGYWVSMNFKMKNLLKKINSDFGQNRTQTQKTHRPTESVVLRFFKIIFIVILKIFQH
jgi:hypothetical protein